MASRAAAQPASPVNGRQELQRAHDSHHTGQGILTGLTRKPLQPSIEPLSGVGKDASSGSLPALIQPGVVGASNGKASQSDSKSSRQVIIQSKQNKSTLFTAQLPTASKAISSVPVSVSQQYRTRNWVGTTFGVDDKVGFGADLSWLTGPAKQSPSSGPLQKIDQTATHKVPTRTRSSVSFGVTTAGTPSPHPAAPSPLQVPSTTSSSSEPPAAWPGSPLSPSGLRSPSPTKSTLLLAPAAALAPSRTHSNLSPLASRTLSGSDPEYLLNSRPHPPVLPGGVRSSGGGASPLPPSSGSPTAASPLRAPSVLGGGGRVTLPPLSDCASPTPGISMTTRNATNTLSSSVSGASGYPQGPTGYGSLLTNTQSTPPPRAPSRLAEPPVATSLSSSIPTLAVSSSAVTGDSSGAFASSSLLADLAGNSAAPIAAAASISSPGLAHLQAMPGSSLNAGQEPSSLVDEEVSATLGYLAQALGPRQGTATITGAPAQQQSTPFAAAAAQPATSSPANGAGTGAAPQTPTPASPPAPVTPQPPQARSPHPHAHSQPPAQSRRASSVKCDPHPHHRDAADMLVESLLALEADVRDAGAAHASWSGSISDLLSSSLLSQSGAAPGPILPDPTAAPPVSLSMGDAGDACGAAGGGGGGGESGGNSSNAASGKLITRVMAATPAGLPSSTALAGPSAAPTTGEAHPPAAPSAGGKARRASFVVGEDVRMLMSPSPHPGHGSSDPNDSATTPLGQMNAVQLRAMRYTRRRSSTLIPDDQLPAGLAGLSNPELSVGEDVVTTIPMPSDGGPAAGVSLSLDMAPAAEGAGGVVGLAQRAAPHHHHQPTPARSHSRASLSHGSPARHTRDSDATSTTGSVSTHTTGAPPSCTRFLSETAALAAAAGYLTTSADGPHHSGSVIDDEMGSIFYGANKARQQSAGNAMARQGSSDAGHASPASHATPASLAAGDGTVQASPTATAASTTSTAGLAVLKKAKSRRRSKVML